MKIRRLIIAQHLVFVNEAVCRLDKKVGVYVNSSSPKEPDSPYENGIQYWNTEKTQNEPQISCTRK